MYQVRTIFWHKIWRGVVFPLQQRFKRFNLYETDKTLGFRFLAVQTDIRLGLQNFLREPMKVAEISGVLFASCSNAPKRGKESDEFKSLYQNILKLLFCGQISLRPRKTTPPEIPPHMGKRYAVWRRSRIGSALVRVRQPLWSERSAMATYLFHRSGLKHCSTIRPLKLRVIFDGISRRIPELKHLSWTAFIRCIWNTLFTVKAPFAKKCSSSDLCILCLLSSPKSVPMYLVTCWKYKQSHIPISPCRNEPSQLQNCRTKIFTVFGTLLVTWRQREEILSPAQPKTGTWFVSFSQVWMSHSVWYVRHCAAPMVVRKCGPHLVQQ